MLDEAIINHVFISRLVVTLLVLHVLCWSSVYYVALKYKLIAYPYLFLSTAFGWDPARAIASFILPIISVLTGLLLYMRSMLIKPRIKTTGHRRLWKAFNLCSVLSCIGLLGVSAISVYTNIFVHLIFAFLVFIAGILIMLISTVLDSSLKLSVSPTILALRYGLTAIAIVSGSLLGVFFVPYPFFGSVMEMIAAGAMTAYVWTFAHKLDKLESAYLELGQVPKFPDHAVHRRRIV